MNIQKTNTSAVTAHAYVCMIRTYHVLIQAAHTIYYVLAAVFASCFYVLFKFRFVREGTQGGTLVTSKVPKIVINF